MVDFISDERVSSIAHLNVDSHDKFFISAVQLLLLILCCTDSMESLNQTKPVSRLNVLWKILSSLLVAAALLTWKLLFQDSRW